MKVLLINASPHEKGSTYTALSQMLTVFEEQGIETTLMNIGKKAGLSLKVCKAIIEEIRDKTSVLIRDIL